MEETKKTALLYDGYVERMQEIRLLSTPSLEGISDEDEYSERLRKNFIRIGVLASRNREFLDSVLYPLVRSERPLTDEETEEIISFASNLVSAANAENLDLPIMFLLSDRLLKDAKKLNDLSATIHRLDARIDTCYGLMTVMGRVSAYPRMAEPYRREGLLIGDYFLKLLEPEHFSGIKDEESREIVLTNARYATVFYEKMISTDPDHNPEIDLLDRLLTLSDSDFHHQLVPDFDWRYFHYRVLNYYASATDDCNLRCFGENMLNIICDRTEEFRELWESDPVFFGRLENETHVRMLVSRNRYLAGRQDAGSYRDELIRLYRLRDPDLYDLNGIYENLQIPAEYICLLDQKQLSGSDMQHLDQLYRNMILYAFRMPNGGSLSSMLEYYINIINHFIEVPNSLSFEEMGLYCMVALHPPTYIHSVMVAELASCLCRHLIDRMPDLMIGILGCSSPEEVKRRQEEICDFTYHAGLCHDFGKLSIIDTIIVYGRKLLDMEFELIKTHPLTGYQMLSRFESTKAYADAALGHHRWYDNSRGYPDDFDASGSKIRTIIALIQCADCLDAATDSVGRSYNRGKSYEDFVEEIRIGSGTQYAPWLMELLTDEATSQDIHTLLEEGRRKNYRNTYHLLAEMH